MSHLTYGYLESGRLAPSNNDLARLGQRFGDGTRRMFDRVGSTTRRRRRGELADYDAADQQCYR